MRYLFIFILFFFNLHAEQTKQKLTLGLGAYVQTQPYKDVESIVLPSPVIFFDNGILYVRWTRAGVYFLGDVQDEYSWGFSLTAQPRVYGYGDSDIQGMNERKNSWEGGIAFSAKADKAYLEIIALTDILNKHDLWILNTELGYDFKLGNFSFYPSLVLSYQSSKFLDYYYGVTPSEELPLRGEYTPQEGLQLGIQTYINYPLTDKLSVFANIKIDKLSQEATNSPLVDDAYIYSGLCSLIYTFEY
ncbi:MipA/OmpV family protein [bacterium]|nr:MipA/OmpV family protein [bacterium]MBU1990849.1 MipA/OmpV family protein [bacterium]